MASKQWCTVKTKNGHEGQVLVDVERPISEQIGDDVAWYGINLPKQSYPAPGDGTENTAIGAFLLVIGFAVLGAALALAWAVWGGGLG